MSNEITKCRILRADNELIKLVALKLTADKMRVVTTAEVLHALLKSFNQSGERSADEIVNAIRNQL